MLIFPAAAGPLSKDANSFPVADGFWKRIFVTRIECELAAAASGPVPTLNRAGVCERDAFGRAAGLMSHAFVRAHGAVSGLLQRRPAQLFNPLESSTGLIRRDKKPPPELAAEAPFME